MMIIIIIIIIIIWTRTGAIWRLTTTTRCEKSTPHQNTSARANQMETRAGNQIVDPTREQGGRAESICLVMMIIMTLVPWRIRVCKNMLLQLFQPPEIGFVPRVMHKPSLNAHSRYDSLEATTHEAN